MKDNDVAEIIIFAIIGIAFAGLLGVLNNSHILVDSYLTVDITITEVQAIVIIFWVFIGIAVTLTKK